MSQTSSRTLFECLPGHLVFDSATFYSETGWKAAISEEVVEIQSDNFGIFDSAPVGRLVKISGKPQQFTPASLAKLFPHGAKRMGASIFGTSDKAAVLHLVDGTKMTVPCAAVYKEPAMICGAGKPILGEVEFWGIAGLNADAGLLATYFAKATQAYPGDTTWDGTEVLAPAWHTSWTDSGGASAWDNIDTKEGVTITPQATMAEDKPDGKGLRNVRISGYKVNATLEPMNISRDLLLAAFGFGEALGSRKSALGRTLKMRAEGGGAFVYLHNAVLKAEAEQRYNAKELVSGQLTFEAMSRSGASPLNPLFTVTTVDPDEE
jgi:hypothetical protein